MLGVAVATGCDAVKEHPILFSGAMVRAVVDGSKTQTRRHLYTVQKMRPGLAIDQRYPPPRGTTEAGFPDTPVGRDWGLNHWQHLAVGHRLWGKETFALVGGGDPGLPLYRATWREDAKRLRMENADKPPKWTPSIHMPRWVSRLVLDVVALRVERLQRISEADALAEGVVKVGERWEVPGIVATPISARAAYAYLWEFINGPGSWHANPWVRVIGFKKSSE